MPTFNKTPGAGGAKLVYSRVDTFLKGYLPNLSYTGVHCIGTEAGTSAIFRAGHLLTLYLQNETKGTNPAVASATHTNYACAASTGDKAVFAGGANSGNTALDDAVDFYDVSGVKATPSTLTSVQAFLNGAGLDGKAFFAGGLNATNIVNAFLSNGTRSTPSILSEIRNEVGAASTSSKVFFAGGSIAAAKSSTVDAYIFSETRTTPTQLNTARSYIAGAGCSSLSVDKVFFAGGLLVGNSTSSSEINVYSDNGTKGTNLGLSTASNRILGTSIENKFAVFGGGVSASKVYIINGSGVQSALSNLDVQGAGCGAAFLGNKAIFAGGWHNSTAYNIVQSYSNTNSSGAPIPSISIPLGSVYSIDGGPPVTVTSNSEDVTIGRNSVLEVRYKNAKIETT